MTKDKCKCGCVTKNENDRNYNKGDYLEFYHKKARYFVVVANVYSEKQLKEMGKSISFPYHLVGIRIGCQVTASGMEDESGDFISTHESYWSITECKSTKNLLTYEIPKD